jgi:hypothetical protein
MRPDAFEREREEAKAKHRAIDFGFNKEMV